MDGWMDDSSPAGKIEQTPLVVVKQIHEENRYREDTSSLSTK
jgi:hypothetical protein